MPFHREAEVVPAVWRAAGRQLASLAEDSPEADGLRADLARYREEYRRLIDAALAHNRLAPPRIPEPDSD